MFFAKPSKRDVFDPLLMYEPACLRKAHLNDFQEWAALREESREHLTAWEQDWSPEDINLASFRRRIRNYERVMKSETGLPLLVFRQDDNQMAGGVTLSNIRYGAARAATLGYWIGERFAKQGLGSAAVKAVLTHAFERIELNRVEAACQPGNKASQRVLEKCGFQQEGFARDYLKINGQWRDHAIFAITAADHRRIS